MKAKRAFLLVPVSASLVLAAVIDLGDFAIGKPGRAAIVSALKDPLSLFAARSPGGRGPGALLSTKPARTAANSVPQERVLSSEREREPPAVTTPVMDLPDFTVPAEEPGASNALPTGGSSNPGFGASPFLPLRTGLGPIPQGPAFGVPPVVPVSPGDGTVPAGPGFGLPPLLPGGDGAGPEGPVSGLPPSAPLFPIIEPGNPPIIVTPGTEPDSGPPAILPVPPDAPPGPITINVPEPATWTMMLLGLFAVSVAARRRVRRPE